MRIVAGVCFAALALAACNKTSEKAEAAAGAPATAAVEAPVPAGIDAAPHLKAGLWEITPANMPGKVTSCIDDATQSDTAVLGQGLDRRKCAKSDWSRTPTGIAFSFDCDNNGTRVTSKGTITGDFNTAYRMEADASLTKGGITKSTKQVIDARYLGACPAGMKPGDKQITINGRTMSLPNGAGDGYGGPSAPGG